MKKIIILLILSLFMVTGCSYNEVESKMISVKDVNDIIENFENEENTFIVDVRELNEYEEGHLINSINIPLSIIGSINDIPEINKDSKIIVYCRSGNRSKSAQSRLNSLGYTNVYDMGGILDWPYTVYKDSDVEG